MPSMHKAMGSASSTTGNRAVHTDNAALGRWGQEDQKFKVILSYKLGRVAEGIIIQSFVDTGASQAW